MATTKRKRLQATLRDRYLYNTNTNFGRGTSLIRGTDRNNPTSAMTITLDKCPKSDDSGVLITMSNVMCGNGVSISMGYEEACMLANVILEMNWEVIEEKVKRYSSQNNPI